MSYREQLRDEKAGKGSDGGKFGGFVRCEWAGLLSLAIAARPAKRDDLTRIDRLKD
jgi:hypothetical protein